jgi:hypothetical protein
MRWAARLGCGGAAHDSHCVTSRAQVLLSDAALELLKSGRVRLHARVH